jgi:hypothetical protein
MPEPRAAPAASRRLDAKRDAAGHVTRGARGGRVGGPRGGRSPHAAQRDNARHDRNLLARYPRKERHDVARRAALDDIVKATLASEARLQELAKERKVLDDEAEFYKARMLPAKLKASS